MKKQFNITLENVTDQTDNIELYIAQQLCDKKKLTVTIEDYRSQRSKEISTRFHGWCTYMAKKRELDRNYVYYNVLIKACEIEADGGSPYPYVIIDQKGQDILMPLRTSGCTNKQMMTACFACELYASQELELVLPERVDINGNPL